MKKIISYIKNIPKKPEGTRIKIMWALIVFFMLIIIGVWWIDFAYNKTKKINFNQSALPSFPEFNNGADDINKLNEQKDKIANELEVAAGQEAIKEIAKSCLKENNLISEEGISNLRLKSVEKQENKLWSLKYQQYYKDVLVNESDISFAIDDAEKKIVSFESNYDPDITLDVAPKITAEEAYNLAVKTLGGKELNLENLELVVYKDTVGASPKYYLAWKISIVLPQPSRNYCYFVSAGDGRIISHYGVEKN